MNSLSILGFSKGDELVQSELEKCHDDHRQELGQKIIPSQTLGEQVNQQLAQSQTGQSYQVEKGESLDGTILHLEIVLLVENKAADNPGMDADDIGP